MDTKICTKCRDPKPLSDFRKGNDRFGLNFWCQLCWKRYRAANRYGIAQYQAQYRTLHRQQKVTYATKYYQDNRQKLIGRSVDRERVRLASDLDFKLRKGLRSRLFNAVRKGFRGGSAVGDLGCTIPEFRLYVESMFTSDMAWENWGTVWQLDHVKSLACFDLTDREQFLKAAHYTNLQPLKIEDHRLKSAQQEWRGE